MHIPHLQRKLDHVLAALKDKPPKGCTLLIGAGCSVKAGIPLAKDFVEIIKEKYPLKYAAAKDKTYPQCMAELAPGQRRGLISKYVNDAKINWAHICIASLIRHNFVTRVLTVNFDPLVIKSCALLGVFPAVYDFSASQFFKQADIPDQAVFYLHGQLTGFRWKNTQAEVEEQSKLLGPVLEEAGQKRVWIVVGYSGECDPVFDKLVDASPFDDELYWVCHQNEEPAQHVRDKLLKPGKYAYYVNGYDADGFFVTLAQKLGIFPPDFTGKPFSYLNQLLEMLATYSIPGQSSDVDVTLTARKLIKEAIERFEIAPQAPQTISQPEESSALAMRAQDLFLAGDYDAVIAMKPKDEKLLGPELSDTLAWAYIMQGNALWEKGGEASKKEDAAKLFAAAAEKYRAALELEADSYEALYNWGLALDSQASLASEAEAIDLLAKANEKYQAALKIRSDSYEALINWGQNLNLMANLSSGEKAKALLEQATRKFQAALKLKPDDPELLKMELGSKRNLKPKKKRPTKRNPSNA